MEDKNTFKILFRGQINIAFNKAMNSIGARIYYGYCDNKDEMTNKIKEMEGLIHYFFIEPEIESESQVFLRSLKNKTIYERINPDKKKGKYVFVYIVKPV